MTMQRLNNWIVLEEVFISSPLKAYRSFDFWLESIHKSIRLPGNKRLCDVPIQYMTKTMLLWQTNMEFLWKSIVNDFSLHCNFSVKLAVLGEWKQFLKTFMSILNWIHFLPANASVASWCGKYGNALDIGTFKVAQQLEALNDGLYKCSGEFARLPGDPFRAFKIDNCTALDAGELRLECTKP